MKNILLKLTVFLSALLMVCPLGCARNGGTGEDSVTDSMTEPPLPLAGYTVIRADGCSDAVRDAAVAVRNALLAELGGSVTLRDDWHREDEPLPDTAKEILVGSTNRPESAGTENTLKRDDFVIRVCPSGRIVITGGSEPATVAAAEYFIKNLVGGAGASLSLPAGFSYSSGGSYPVSSMTLCGIPVSDWTLVIPARADCDEQYAAELISARISEACGAVLKTVSDAKAPRDNLILVGATSLTPADYSSPADRTFVTGKTDAGIVVNGDGGLVVMAARRLLSRILTENGGTINADVPAAASVTYTPAAYPANPDLSGMPVALADQQNACAAIYDVSPALTGGAPALLRTFAPTAALGYTVANYAQRIDEARLRYSEVLDSYVICITSSSGYCAVGKYPSGECVWNTSLPGYGPHSIEYLPNGSVAVACSGNGDETRSCIRLYAATTGKTSAVCDSLPLTGAHAVLWDDTRGILWALGSSDITAYETGGTDAAPMLTEIACYASSFSCGGHDMSAVPGDPDSLWIGGSGIWLYNKKTKTFSTSYEGYAQIKASSVKCIGSFPDGTVIRTVATNVFAAHDTDRFSLFISANGGITEKSTVISGRAFYKARIFSPYYS